MRSAPSARRAILAAALATAACSASPTAPPTVAPTRAGAPAASAPADREALAVLPLRDDRLFRAERAELRGRLATSLARVATEYAVLPLAEVDAKLRPVSKATGARCAFEDASVERRARAEGWATTDVLHVAGRAPAQGELWVTVGSLAAGGPTFAAPWDERLARVDGYRAAFAALARQDGEAGLLGGLGASTSYAGSLREGPITICEARPLSTCDPGTSGWKDAAGALAACFAGQDEGVVELLLQGGPAPRCEVADLDQRDGPEAAREACLCRALGASAALRARPERRGVHVAFEAPDLAGRPRPELRVVDATANLPAELATSYEQAERGGRVEQRSVQRLVVDALDALAAPLARCEATPGAVALADLDLKDDGRVAAVHLATPLAKGAACVEKALAAAGFACTDDGKPARLRVALAWR
jgi:hypothetical protein